MVYSHSHTIYRVLSSIYCIIHGEQTILGVVPDIYLLSHRSDANAMERTPDEYSNDKNIS